jgi:CheY-like chemotaxis protein
MQSKPGTPDNQRPSSAQEAECALDVGDTAAAKFADDAQPASQWRPQPRTNPRLLLARTDDAMRSILAPLQDAIGPVVIDEVTDGIQLDEALQNNGPYALVISQAMLPGARGLEVLAKARERGDNTPFVLIQSIHQNFVRITIGGGPNTIISTRLVNTVALLDLVQQIVCPREVPTAPRR